MRVSFRRDAAGRPLEREDYFGDDSPRNRSYRYRYNEHGDAVEVRTMDAAGRTLGVRRTRYSYDTEARMIEWWASDESGTPIGGGRHFYDVDGNRVETLERTGQGEPKLSRRFTYQRWD